MNKQNIVVKIGTSMVMYKMKNRRLLMVELFKDPDGEMLFKLLFSRLLIMIKFKENPLHLGLQTGDEFKLKNFHFLIFCCQLNIFLYL